MRSYLGPAAAFILQTHPTFIIPFIQKRIKRLGKSKIPAKAAVPTLSAPGTSFPEDSFSRGEGEGGAGAGWGRCGSAEL